MTELIDEMERLSTGRVQRALAAEARANPAMARQIHRRWQEIRLRAETQRRRRAATTTTETG